MSVFKSDFLDILYNRGFIHQISDESNLDTLLAHNSPLTAYIGFDATAKSLHAGSLIPIMMLYWFQKTGNRPIVLLGGATSMIGDPSFRDESRKILSPQEIQTNLEGIRKNFTPYLSCGSGPSDALFENNADWLLSLSYIDFLRDIGSHFSVNRMLSFDSVKQRLDREQTLSFLEFNYMILQAYDFKKLFELYGCRLQMGGSDQWGNIINGMELGRRTGTLPLFALTSPLLTTASGAKMGKSGAQTVWLDSNLCSPYNFWQYWRNTEDKDVVRFLHLYTILPLDEINKLAQLKGAEINEAKKILATEITSMLHGREAAEKAESAARETFEEGVIADHLPTLEIPLSTLQEGIGLLSLCVQAGLAQSNSQARRSIREGALRVNNIVILEEESIIKQEHLESDYAITLSLGKKKHVRIRVSS